MGLVRFVLLVLRRKRLPTPEITALPYSPSSNTVQATEEKKASLCLKCAAVTKSGSCQLNKLTAQCYGCAEVPFFPVRPYHYGVYFLTISTHCAQNAHTKMVSYVSVLNYIIETKHQPVFDKNRQK